MKTNYVNKQVKQFKLKKQFQNKQYEYLIKYYYKIK